MFLKAFQLIERLEYWELFKFYHSFFSEPKEMTPSLYVPIFCVTLYFILFIPAILYVTNARIRNFIRKLCRIKSQRVFLIFFYSFTKKLNFECNFCFQNFNTIQIDCEPYLVEIDNPPYPPNYLVSNQSSLWIRRHLRRNPRPIATMENGNNNLTSMRIVRQTSIAIGFAPTNALPSYQEHVFSSVRNEIKSRRKFSLPVVTFC